MEIQKRATLHLLLVDVLVTQHAKWTAKRIRRGLFGQSIVDFTSASWSGVQLKESANDTASQQRRAQPKKTPRLLRSFAQARVVAEKNSSLVPGMSLYDDIEMDAGTADHPCSPSLSTGVATRDKEVSQESDAVSAISGSEGSIVSRR